MCVYHPEKVYQPPSWFSRVYQGPGKVCQPPEGPCGVFLSSREGLLNSLVVQQGVSRPSEGLPTSRGPLWCVRVNQGRSTDFPCSLEGCIETQGRSANLPRAPAVYSYCLGKVYQPPSWVQQGVSRPREGLLASHGPLWCVHYWNPERGTGPPRPQP